MSMFRAIRQIFLALAVVLTGAVIVAAPASAHTGDLKASVSCVNGKQHVVYTLTFSSVPSGNTGSTRWKIGTTSFTGTPSSNSGLTNGPISSNGNVTITLGSEDYPGDYAGAGNWVYAYTVWSPDNFGKGSDGRIDKFAGNCLPKDASYSSSISNPTCDKGAVLTYSGSNVVFTGPASGLTGPKTAAQATVTAVPSAGHLWSDGTKASRTVSNAALAGPLDPDSDACAAKNATAGVAITPAQCGVPGGASVTNLTFATLSGTLDQSVGTHTATFTAASGHRFADGSKTKNVQYTVPGAIDPDSDQCANQNSDAGVSVFPPTCDAPGSAQVVGLAFATLNGTLDQSVGTHTATFTAAANHRFPGGSKTKTVEYTIAGQIPADDDQCAKHDAAAAVTVSPPSCDSAGVASIGDVVHASLVGVLDQSVGTHTATFAADSGHRFADGSKTKGVQYTIANKIDADDDQCAKHDAAAAVTVSPPSCDSAGVASVGDVAHASLVGVLDQSVGTHTATFAADSGHRFADGSKTKGVQYTITDKIDADDDQCAQHNADAGVKVTAPGCDSPGSAGVSGLSFATLDGVLDQSVGTHTAHFVADAGHRFEDGSKTKDVVYTIAGQIDADDDQCAKHDAAAAVVVTEPGCTLDGSAMVSGLSHATLQGVLDQSVGTHTATFLADSGHRFDDGSKTKDVEYTITALSDEEYFEQCAPEQPVPEQRVVPNTEQSCKLGGVHSWDEVYTTPYVWNAVTRAWELGAETGPVTENDLFTAYTTQELEDLGCIEVEGEQGHHGHHGHHGDHNPGTPEVKGEQATVPTQVEAGLATVPASPTQETPGRNPLWLLVMGAGLSLALAGRRRGKNSL